MTKTIDMKLHEVLKTFVDNNDAGILYEDNFINKISDLYPNVFQPSSLKKILKYVIEEEYAIWVMDEPKKIELTISKLTNEIIKKAGYSEIYTSYVLRCIAYAVGYNVNLKEELLELENESATTNNYISNDKGDKKFVNSYGPTPQKKDENHLSFKNVKIFGDAKSFVEKMFENGYSIIKKESTDSNYMLKGSYAGMKSKLMVQVSPKTHRTSRVMVIFDDKEYKNWPALKALYFNLKDKLTKKYGKPSSSTEAFLPPHKEGDGNEIELLDSNLGAYQSKFNADGGEVGLVIMSEARVIIAFMDTLGCIELNREFEQAVQDDM